MLAIEIKNLFKEYQLGLIASGTLYRDLQSLYAKFTGKDDPNSIIGSDNRITNSKIISLNDINLKIERGQIFGIIGKNGAGKSTLLKIISKITLPTHGSVKIKGHISSLLEVGTGFHPELTGLENIYLNAAINGMSKAQTEKKINKIAEFAGVENFLNTPVKRYSTGMRVRLGFGVAVNLNPDIFIVDEVLAVGDASFQKKAIDEMKKICQDISKTIILVSHNMETIRELCTNVALLENGSIVKVGNSSEVIDYYIKSTKSIKSNIEYINKKDSDCYISSFYLVDKDNNKTKRIDRTKEFKIVMRLFLKNDFEDLSTNISITTASYENGVPPETTVLQWSDRHYAKMNNQTQTIHRKKGEYEIKVDVPANIINIGKYRLNVRLIHKREVLDYEKNGIIFELYDSDSSHVLDTGHSSGLVAMNLNWIEQKVQ